MKMIPLILTRFSVKYRMLVLFIAVFSLLRSTRLSAIDIAEVRFYKYMDCTQDDERCTYREPVLVDNVKFQRSVWKVYYDYGGRSLGEEYYVNQKLQQYAIYIHYEGFYKKVWYYWQGFQGWVLLRTAEHFIHYGYYYSNLMSHSLYYDQNNRLFQKVWYDHGAITQMKRYQYDAFGRLYKIDLYQGITYVGSEYPK